jgi:hypothetical protein
MYHETRTEKGSGNVLSFLLSGGFFLIVGAAFHLLDRYELGVRSIRDVTPFEFFILVLAVFRLTRLVVYDTVSQFVRDLFLDTTTVEENGVVYVDRKKPARGFRRLVADLLSCPWCVGMWASTFSVVIYFLVPITWPFWLLLAVAGGSTLIQLTVNLIGWRAEYGKKIVEELDK